MGTLADTYNLREDIARMNDVADFVDSFDEVVTWSPVYTPSGSMTFTSVTTTFAEYTKIGNFVFVNLRAQGTIGGTLSNAIGISFPLTFAKVDTPLGGFYRQPTTSGSIPVALGFCSGTSISFRRGDATNFIADTLTIRLTGWVKVS
jgi:hypothetical protein